MLLLAGAEEGGGCEDMEPVGGVPGWQERGRLFVWMEDHPSQTCAAASNQEL